MGVNAVERRGVTAAGRLLLLLLAGCCCCCGGVVAYDSFEKIVKLFAGCGRSSICRGRPSVEIGVGSELAMSAAT